MPTRTEIIAEIYPELVAASKRIAHNSDTCMDTLNDVMCAVIESKSPNVPTEKNQLLAYCIRSLELEFKGNTGITYMEKKWTKIRADISEFRQSNIPVDMSARHDNEVMDYAINFLPELERKVFLLYVMDDFSFAELSKATGISKKLLYNTVHSAKLKLRKYVTR